MIEDEAVLFPEIMNVLIDWRVAGAEADMKALHCLDHKYYFQRLLMAKSSHMVTGMRVHWYEAVVKLPRVHVCGA